MSSELASAAVLLRPMTSSGILGARIVLSFRWRRIMNVLLKALPLISLGLSLLWILLGVGLLVGFELEDLFLVATRLVFLKYFLQTCRTFVKKSMCPMFRPNVEVLIN